MKLARGEEILARISALDALDKVVS